MAGRGSVLSRRLVPVVVSIDISDTSGGDWCSKGSAEGRFRTSWRPRRSDLSAGTEACRSCSALQFTDAVAGLVSVGILALVVAIVGGCVWLLVDHHPGRGTAVAFAGLGAVGVFTTVLGAVVAWRVPNNPVGGLLTWAGDMVVFFSALDVYYTCAVRDPGALPLDNRVVAVLNESAWWLFVAVALLLLYFPDGRLPSARWRFVPPALVGLCAAQQAYGTVDAQPYLAPLQDLPRPWGPPSLAVEIAGNVAFAALLALLLPPAYQWSSGTAGRRGNRAPSSSGSRWQVWRGSSTRSSASPRS